MGWKNLRLAMKFALGFGLVLVLLLVVGGWSIFGVSNIVGNAGEVIDGNKLRAEMVQKEVDHLKWAGKVGELLTDDTVTTLDVQMDSHKCGFGKWYYGEGRAQAEKFLPMLVPILAQLEDPHKKLHESAVKIAADFHQADQDLPMFLSEKETDHLNWVNTVLAFFAEDKAELTIGTDGQQCGLGKFIYGEHGKKAAASDPELAHLLEAIKEPHLRLHQSAAKIQQHAADKVAAHKIFEQETLSALSETQAQLKGLKLRAGQLVAGMNAASAIYAKETVPNLHKVQELLGQVITTTTKHVMTDEQMLSAARNTRTGIIALAALALPLGILIAFIIARGIIGPLKKSCTMIQEIGAGHLNMRLNLDSKDEIGQMAKTMDDFADSMQNEVIATLQRFAQGDMTCNLKPIDERDEIRGAMQKLCADLNDVLGQMQQAGEQINSGSAQVSEASQDLSQGATESAASLEEISASLNELSAQTATNAENASQAKQLASEAQSAAKAGSERMESMVVAMSEINAAGQNISKIIKTIDEIAFQTNLLALNAAVEAARAGQHGKGFAVVAEEVRNLAARSAKAAAETAELIEGSVEKTRNGSAIANQTAEALQEIFISISKTSDLVGEIAAASNEQAQGVSEINQGVNQIDQVTQQNTASAEECAASAEELSSQAEAMGQMLRRFTLMGQKQASQVSRVAKKAMPNSAPKKNRAGSTNQGWGRMNKPAPQIALDDQEFGKY